MRIIKRVLVFFGWLFLAPGLGLVLVGLITLRFGDSSLFPVIDGKPVVEIAVANHGVHTGIILKRADLAEVAANDHDPVLLALTDRFSAYPYLEVGWGDEQFYRFAPTLSAVTVSMAFRALAGLDETTVLHVVGLENDAVKTFTHSDVQVIPLAKAGFEKLARRFANSFAINELGDPIELGPGIYGPSLFYRATGHYSVMRTCNHWLSDLLSDAGLASSPVPSVLSIGLMEELRLRNRL